MQRSPSSPPATISVHGWFGRPDGCRRISILPCDPGELLARQAPSAWTRTLAYRPRNELPFDAGTVGAATRVMLDTTVYLDALKPRGLPETIARLVARNVVLHCAIACAELAVSVGHLDPAHPGRLRIAFRLSRRCRAWCRHGSCHPAPTLGRKQRSLPASSPASRAMRGKGEEPFCTMP